MDENLRKRFEIINFWLRFEGKKKKPKNLELKFEEKDYIFTDKGPKLKHPIFKKINGKNVPLFFRTKEEGIEYYQNLKKKDPNLDIREKIASLEATIREGQFYFKKLIKKENKFTWRACAKILYEFLCLIKPDYHPLNKRFVDFVMGRKNLEEISFCIAFLDFKPFKKDIDRIYHIMYIEGRESEQLIIGYLEIFGSLRVLMLIDENYNGKSFTKGYYHNLMDKNDHNYFDPIERISLEKKTIKMMTKTIPQDANLNRCYRESINNQNKARFFPYKKLAEKIRDKIDNEEELNIAQIKEIEEELRIEMEKRGLALFHPDNINKLSPEMMIVQKVIFMLDFLRKSFFLFDMDTTIFKRLIALLIFKGDKYRY